MDFKTFKANATRTLPDLGDIRLDYSHMMMGVFSELNELEDAINKNDIVNISEELSDIFWYLACYDHLRKLNLFNVSEINHKERSYIDDIITNINLFLLIRPYKELGKLYKNCSMFTDIVKKHVAYGKEIDLKDEMLLFGSIVENCVSIFNHYGIDVNKSMENVINKLKKRYPNKFTNEQAINRDLIAERNELEK